MAEQIIRNGQDLQDFVRKIKEEEQITMDKIEKESGVSRGSIRKWDRNSPSLNNVIKVLDYLGMELTVRNNEQENVGQDSKLDVMIKVSLQEILKSEDITHSDKERLYRILRAFL